MKINNKEKGIFLQEFYGVKDIPNLTNENGEPSKFAEAAKYWGEPIPRNSSEVRKLAALGAVLINKEEEVKNKQEVKLSNSIYSGTQSLSTLNSNLIKVPFVKKGSWKHDVYGEVKFTDKDIEELVTNYKNNVTGFTPYLTLGHLDEELNSTDSHRKRGNLNDIIVEGDTTFGIFEVNDEIYSRVQKGEYEYSSGEFHRKFKDRETGKEVGTTVLRVALTNSPFLPFGNDKIQTLSNEAENCPETKENFVFLLSLDTSNSDMKAKDKTEAEQSVEPLLTEPQEITINPEVEVEPILQKTPIENITLLNKESIMSTENNVAETKEVILEAKNEAPTEVAAPVVLEAAEVVVQKETKVEVPQNQGDAILTNLTTQLQKVQDMYAKQLEVANNTINALTQKVEALSDKLVGQEQVTQAFSNSMSAAQERSMIQNLQNNGVLPTNIQRFVALKNAFQSADNKNIVKFSVGTGSEVKEVETNLIDAVAELLISASNQTPLVEQQLGVSAGRRTGGFDFSSIIEKNQAAAQKLNSK